jgi:hypothetical protein
VEVVVSRPAIAAHALVDHEVKAALAGELQVEILDFTKELTIRRKSHRDAGYRTTGATSILATHETQAKLTLHPTFHAARDREHLAGHVARRG